MSEVDRIQGGFGAVPGRDASMSRTMSRTAPRFMIEVLSNSEASPGVEGVDGAEGAGVDRDDGAGGSNGGMLCWPASSSPSWSTSTSCPLPASPGGNSLLSLTWSPNARRRRGVSRQPHPNETVTHYDAIRTHIIVYGLQYFTCRGNALPRSSPSSPPAPAAHWRLRPPCPTQAASTRCRPRRATGRSRSGRPRCR